jgi:hypothetical protein
MKKLFTRVPMIRLIFFSFMIGLIASCGSSRKSVGVEEGWELLAEKKVNFVRDKDEITINNRNQFTALRFKVEDRDVRINDLKIYFQNGDKLEPNIDDVINADQYSRYIELAADGRNIDRIEFKYRTEGSILKGRANVLIFGRKYYRNY